MQSIWDKLGKVVNVFTTVVVILVVIFALLVGGVNLIGIKTYVVLSSSMEPTYLTGSLIYVKPATPDEVSVGNPITFTFSDKVAATHRVIKSVK